ncbi:MAG TPA: ABC transporter ATP-binding protein [Thermoanaerobaculia bacterium]|nr:ABC transporter ATP-binding protein [Thermoanaerobaculia bacterium]
MSPPDAATEPPLVQLSGVSLCYRLAKQRIPSLKEYAIHWMKGALSYEKLWALRDVDFTARRGEVVGIVGRNGAGKSTLLKVISQVLKPTGGKIEIRGRIAPILELGTGFDHELTGMENIYLNALLLGRSRKEIDARLAQIVDFSGLGDFVRAPIRNFSTGMLARLGFSIATAWLPDILILDEVLAVGDASFTKKCTDRMREFHDAGTTVLLVSHNAQAIRDSCTRCVWLDAGRVRIDGSPPEVLDHYAHDRGTEPVERQPG